MAVKVVGLVEPVVLVAVELVELVVLVAAVVALVAAPVVVLVVAHRSAPAPIAQLVVRAVVLTRHLMELARLVRTKAAASVIKKTLQTNLLIMTALALLVT